MKTCKNELWLKSLALVKTVLTVFALSFDKIYDKEESVLAQYAVREELAGPIWCVVAISIFIFYNRCKSSKIKIRAVELVGALIFAFTMLIGRSFARYNTWDLVFYSGRQMFLAICAGTGWAILFWTLLKRVYEYLCARPFWYCNTTFDKKRFMWRAFGVIIWGWIPWLLIRIPGNVPWDGMWQLTRWFGYGGGGQISNHHPWFVSMLYGILMTVGRVINDNAGIFMIILFQIITCALIYSYVCSAVRKYAGSTASWLTVLFFAIVPAWGSYASTVIKDTMFSAIYALWFCILIDICSECIADNDDMKDIRKWYVFGLISFLVCIMRNDGIYRVLPSCIAILIASQPQKKKRMIRTTTGIFLLLTLYNFLIFNVMGVLKGSAGEMLSIPFQQTARYVRDSSYDISDSEYAAVDAILDYDTLGERYSEEISDPVKGKANLGNKEALKQYFSSWLSMGMRHPGIYMQATLNNSYGYFYPFRNNRTQLAYQNYIKGEPLNDGYFNIYYLVDEKFRTYLNNYADLWRVLPGVSLLSNPATYTWLVIFVALLIFRRKKYRELIVLLSPILQIAICVASPLNGNLRYAMPLMASAPVLVAWGIRLYWDGEKKAGSV